MTESRDQKNLTRQKQKLKRQQWLSILSWSTVITAFTGFFAIWHNLSFISSQTLPSTQSNQTEFSHRHRHGDDSGGFSGIFGSSSGQGSVTVNPNTGGAGPILRTGGS